MFPEDSSCTAILEISLLSGFLIQPIFFSPLYRILSTYGPEATKKMFRNLLTEGYTVSWLMRVMSQAELYLISDYLAELVSGKYILPQIYITLGPSKEF